MAIVAKMKCDEAKQIGNVFDGVVQETVKLTPVYSNDPESENYSWSKFTPAGSLELSITNEKIFGYVEPGREYRVTIERIRGPRDGD